jgi:hypothetical protein
MTLDTEIAPESTDVTGHAGHPLTAPAPVTEWPTTETKLLRPERDRPRDSAHDRVNVTSAGHVTTDPVTPTRDHATGHVTARRDRSGHAAHVTGVTATEDASVTEPDVTKQVPAAGHVTDKNGVTDNGKPARAAGAPGYYLVALMSLAVSLNTSWEFFSTVLVISDTRERAAIFAILEVFLIVLGWGMRANVRRGDPPGTPRLVALLLLGFSAYMAVSVSTVWVGVGRVVAGPVIGLVSLHLALGIEKRVHDQVKSAWRRFRDQVKQRIWSRLGLDDEDLSVTRLRRDRAVTKVAKLVIGHRVWRRDARVQAALIAADVAGDPVSKTHLEQHLAVLRNLDSLYNLRPAAPWEPAPETPAAVPVPAAPPAARRRPAARPARRTVAPRPAVDPAPAPAEEPAATAAVAELVAPAMETTPLASNVIQLADVRPGVKEMAARLLAWLDDDETREIPKTWQEIADITGKAKGYAGKAAELVRQELAAREQTA